MTPAEKVTAAIELLGGALTDTTDHGARRHLTEAMIGAGAALGFFDTAGVATLVKPAAVGKTEAFPAALDNELQRISNTHRKGSDL